MDKADKIVENNYSSAPKGVPQQAEDKVGRNTVCPCGSGKKYKQCCGLKKEEAIPQT
ncbi:SEC-C metal-binding domain-containing protein [Chlamydiales bacterium]|nr:SEC-C metal-binding domain-containing protein [Chlamydiales bacterium]